MNITDNLLGSEDVIDVVRETDLQGLADFYASLSEMMELRLHDPEFRNIVDYLSCIRKGLLIANISDEEQERQLKLCSQWWFTFAQLRTEMKLYHERLEFNFKLWFAAKSEVARVALLKAQAKEIEDGVRTAGRYGDVTKDAIVNYVMLKYSQSYTRWYHYLNKVSRLHEFLSNLLDDIKHRSIILMSLRKEKSY
jgi:hypothetical protein